MMDDDFDVELFKNLLQSQRITKDNFFSSDLVKRVQNINKADYESSFRIMSEEEKKIFEPEAFYNLIEIIKQNNIDYSFFEKFIAIAVSKLSKLNRKINVDTSISMIEMISVSGFEEAFIYATINTFADNPELLSIGNLNIN